MGAATSAPAVSRALEDAIEALGGEHSKDVSELVDVFERTEGRKEDTGPAGVRPGHLRPRHLRTRHAGV